MAQLEHLHGGGQALCLFAQALRGSGRLFDQGGVLLGHLVELVDGSVHLADAVGLLGRCG